MPQVFKVGPYWVYFWANENDPLEPVHVHVAEGAPTANGTKIWITKAGKCLLCNNASKIPKRIAAPCSELAPITKLIMLNGYSHIYILFPVTILFNK